MRVFASASDDSFRSRPSSISAEKLPPGYLQALRSDDDFIIYETVNALGEIGPPAVPHLIELFETGSLQVRYWAARALDNIGEPATPALLEALQSDSPQVRWMAAHALGSDRIAESFTYAEAIHYSLLVALRDPDPRVRIVKRILRYINNQDLGQSKN